jgi:hypothetical protein
MRKRDQEHYEIASSVRVARLRDLSSTAFTMRNIPTECRDRSQAIIV